MSRSKSSSDAPAVTLGGSVSRRYVGDTTLVGGTLSSNADRNWSGFGLTARASYKLTPILSTYLEAKADRAYYDAVSAGTGVRSDNWTYQATARAFRRMAQRPDRRALWRLRA